MKIAIVFDSQTGNTKQLANIILENCNNEEIVYFGSPAKIEDVDLIFIGSWVDKGNLSLPIIEFVESLNNQKIALFATCGFGGSTTYFDMLANNFDQNINKSNQILGHFICQGKMPQSIRNRYVKMLEANPEDQRLQTNIANFDQALLHPDDVDLLNVKKYTLDILAKM